VTEIARKRGVPFGALALRPGAVTCFLYDVPKDFRVFNSGNSAVLVEHTPPGL